MRSRVSAALAAGGRPGPLLAVYGTVKLCHTSPGCLAQDPAPTLKGDTPANRRRRRGRVRPRRGSDWPVSAGRCRTRVSQMGAVASRESYFDTGLDVLSDLGYGGLKLAEVCQRLGVTSGSFYHYFSNWSAYTRELVAHWKQVSTTELVAMSREEHNPRQRIEQL